MTTRVNNPYQKPLINQLVTTLQIQQASGIAPPQYDASNFFEEDFFRYEFLPPSEPLFSSYRNVQPHSGPECPECVQTIQFLSQRILQLEDGMRQYEEGLYQFYTQDLGWQQPPLPSAYWKSHQYYYPAQAQQANGYDAASAEFLVSEETSYFPSDPVQSPSARGSDQSVDSTYWRSYQHQYAEVEQQNIAYARSSAELLTNEETSHVLSDSVQNPSAETSKKSENSETPERNSEDTLLADDDVDEDGIAEHNLAECVADDLSSEETKSLNNRSFLAPENKKTPEKTSKSLTVKTKKKPQKRSKTQLNANSESHQTQKNSQVPTKAVQTHTPKDNSVQKNKTDASTEKMLLEEFERKGELLLKNHESKKYAYETPIEDVLNDFIDLMLKGDNSACFMKEFYEGLDTPKSSKAIVEDLKRHCKPLKSENIRPYLQQLKDQNKQLCLINRTTKECNLLV